MIISQLDSGRGIGGAIDYVTHDARQGDTGPHPTTADRVAWTACINSPIDDPQLTGAVMRGIVRDAPALKAAAGISNRGRKLQNRIAHFVISWEPGREVPREHAEDVAHGLMKKLDVEAHVAVVAMHTETNQRHFHLLICTVHPTIGRAETFGHSKRKCQSFAADYERNDGRIVVPLRQELEAARDARRQAIDAGDVERQRQANDRLRLLRSRRQRRRQRPGRRPSPPAPPTTASSPATPAAPAAAGTAVPDLPIRPGGYAEAGPRGTRTTAAKPPVPVPQRGYRR